MLNDVLQVTAELDQEFKSTQIRYVFVCLFVFLPLYHMPSQCKGLHNQLQEFLG